MKKVFQQNALDWFKPLSEGGLQLLKFTFGIDNTHLAKKTLGSEARPR